MLAKISLSANVILITLIISLFFMYSNSIKELEKTKYQVIMCENSINKQNAKIKELELNTKEYNNKKESINKDIESKYNAITSKEYIIKEVASKNCVELEKKYKELLKEKQIAKELLKARFDFK